MASRSTAARLASRGGASRLRRPVVASRAMRTVLTLVRHGETAANLEKVWHGSIDTPLTPRGADQARRVAEYVNATRADARAIYASPLTRTRLTAAEIGAALGLPVRIEPDLAELHLGDWEGRSYRELFLVEKMWDRMRDDPDFAAPGAESARGVARRVAAALRRIAAAHAGERVIAVSHGGALSLGLGFLLDGEPNVWTRVLDNCAVCDLAIGPDVELLSFNLTEHLAGP